MHAAALFQRQCPRAEGLRRRVYLELTREDPLHPLGAEAEADHLRALGSATEDQLGAGLQQNGPVAAAQHRQPRTPQPSSIVFACEVMA